MIVSDLFDRGAMIAPNRLAFTGAGADFTFGAAQALANQIAHAFLRDGFGPETPYAGFSPNCGEVVITQLGATRAGGAWCNVNLRNSLEGNIDILSRGGCEVLFFHSSASEQVTAIRKSVPSLKLAVCVDGPDTNGPALDEWVQGEPETRPLIEVDSRSVGFQGSTGGTTGAPKITMATHERLVYDTLGWNMALHFDAPPVNLAVTPVTHAAGMIVLAHLAMGGTNVMRTGVEFPGIFQWIEEFKVTSLFLPPTVIYMMLAHPDREKYDLSSLKYLISAAAPIAPERIAECVKAFGPVFCQSYGQTEACFPMTFISPEEIETALGDPAKRHRLGSCGRPTLTVSGMAVLDDKGRPLPPGEKGEIVGRSPAFMLRYRNDEKATSEVQKHGWHHTGDIGYCDEDGYFYITDRKRDMIISGGFNIFPFEVEQTLLEHAAIQDVAVVGIPDEKWGEAVKAVVQLAPGASASAEELIAHCKTKLGSMKAPKSIDFWEELPRSPVGKILRRVVRDKFWEGKGRTVN